MASAVAALVLGLLPACGVSYLPVPKQPTATVPPGEPLMAGVEQVDITPPIGLGMFGHGPESRVATGVALRLRCQIFVITGPRGDGATESLALVPCDLAAPSLALQREIARQIAGAVPIPASRIALMATHTHFGPGHYLPSGNYNGPFSSRRIGYDPHVVRFLAKRIAKGIKDAYKHRLQAQLGWKYSEVAGISRNRAMTPLRLNRSLPPALSAMLSSAPAHPEEAAVDRRLSVLRIDLQDDESKKYVPRGALAFFGVHPSVIGNDNSLYSGDLFGYATRHAAATLKEAGARVIVGLANGLEGDVTSDRGDDSPEEAERLGHRLGSAIADLFKDIKLSPAGPLQVAYQELYWPGAALRDGSRLCEQAEVGTVSAGGASDHPTSMRIFAAARPGTVPAEGLASERCDPFKFPLITPDPDPAPGANFPAVAPIMIARVGDGAIAMAPAELTTVTGMRIAQTIEGAMPAGLTSPVTMVGLTNEYLLYVASEDEYAAQFYEGAATVYGPRSARFLQEQFACLSGRLFAHPPSTCFCHGEQKVPVDSHAAAPYIAMEASVLPESSGPRAPFRKFGAVEASCHTDGSHVYALRLSGPEPGRVGVREAMQVRVLCGATVVDDDEGEHVWVRYDDRAVEGHWRVEWRVPAGDDISCGYGMQLQVKSAGDSSITAPFSPDCDDSAAAGVTP